MQSQHIIAQTPIYTFFSLQYMPPCTHFEADIQEHKSSTETSRTAGNSHKQRKKSTMCAHHLRQAERKNPFAKFLNA